MRLLILLIGCAFFCGTAWAQRLTGTYTIPTSSGAITLTFNDAGGQLSGTLVGDDGLTFQLQGQSEADDAMGAVLNQNGQVAQFEAYLDEQGLIFLLIPLDQQAQPNYEAASEFIMQRQGGTAGSSGATPPNPAPQPQNPFGVPSSPPPGSPMPGQATGFAGTFSGAFNGTPTTLTLQQQGTTLQGEANAGGYRYVLSGNVNGQMAQGVFSDPQTGGGFQFEMAMQGTGLTMTLLAQDPNTGQVQRIPAQFQRGAAAQPGPGVQQGGYPPQAGGTPGGAADNFERDQRMVGVWRYSDTMISGSYSMVSETFMQVNPDGSYAYGDGRVMAGGSNANGSIHGDTGSGGGSVSGKWRTQNGIVYIQEAGSPQWVPYAKYYIEGAKMMFTFGDGSKQIWYRQ